MKLGVENRKQLIALGVLGALALFMLGRALWPSSPSAPVAKTNSTATKPATRRTASGEMKKVFLSQGEDIFIASEGDIVNRRYRVLHISPNAVDVEDVLNNNRQSLPLTQG